VLPRCYVNHLRLFSIVGNDEIGQVPGVLIGLNLDLLRLLLHGQLACRHQRARALSIGGEDQLDSTDIVVPGARARIQLAKGEIAIGNETNPAACLRGQFDDVLDIVSYASAGESDTSLRLHSFQNINETLLARALEGIDQRLLIVWRGKLLDHNVDTVHAPHLRACPHSGRLNRHPFLSLDYCAEAHQQQEHQGDEGVAMKSGHVFLCLLLCGHHACIAPPPGAKFENACSPTRGPDHTIER